MKHIDVLCIGHACCDLNFSIDNHPGPDGKALASAIITEGGGPASNAAYGINLLGGTAAFAGRLGKDPFGKAHIDELRSVGVDVSCILEEDTITPLSSVLVDKAGFRSIVNYRDTSAPGSLSLTGLDPACLLLDGHEWEASERALDRFPDKPSILDAGSFREPTDVLSRQVTYLVTSRPFASDATGTEDPEVWLNKLAERCANVAVTDGQIGVYWRQAGKQGYIPAKPVKTVDTTGAGDIFHGAFALAIAKNCSFQESLLWSNEIAAISVGRKGGRSSFPKSCEAPPLNPPISTAR